MDNVETERGTSGGTELIKSTGSDGFGPFANRDRDWKKDYDSVWKKAEKRQSEKMHYRRALYAACDGDKKKVREFLEATEQNSKLTQSDEQSTT